MATFQIDIPMQQIAEICKQWKIRELSIFGSVLREDFGPSSDIDLMVSFSDEADLSLWGFVELKHEFEDLFGRDVDLVEKEGLRNPYRRKSILESAQVIYAA